MKGLILLEQARKAGLVVRAEGDHLVVLGRRRKERLARRLLDHKDEVLAALQEESAPSADDGTWPAERAVFEALHLKGLVP